MISRTQMTLSEKRLDWLFSNLPDCGSGKNLWSYSSRNYTRSGSVCTVQTFTRSLIRDNMFLSTVLARYLHQQRSSKDANKHVSWVVTLGSSFSYTPVCYYSGHLYIFCLLLRIVATSRARWLDVCTKQSKDIAISIEANRSRGQRDDLFRGRAVEWITATVLSSWAANWQKEKISPNNCVTVPRQPRYCLNRVWYFSLSFSSVIADISFTALM